MSLTNPFMWIARRLVLAETHIPELFIAPVQPFLLTGRVHHQQQRLTAQAIAIAQDIAPQRPQRLLRIALPVQLTSLTGLACNHHLALAIAALTQVQALLMVAVVQPPIPAQAARAEPPLVQPVRRNKLTDLAFSLRVQQGLAPLHPALEPHLARPALEPLATGLLPHPPGLMDQAKRQIVPPVQANRLTGHACRLEALRLSPAHQPQSFQAMRVPTRLMAALTMADTLPMITSLSGSNRNPHLKHRPARFAAAGFLYEFHGYDSHTLAPKAKRC